MVRVIFRYILLIETYDSLLLCHYILQIIGSQIFINSCRHSTYYKIKAEYLHHLFMDEFIYSSPFSKMLPQSIYNSIVDTNCCSKLLQIKRIHIFHIHISHWCRTEILDLHTQ